MALVPTDGSSTSGSSAGSSDQWESMLADGIAATGIDPNAPLEDLPDSSNETTQDAAPASSAGSREAEPSAPQAASTGDGGTPPGGSTQATPVATDPAASTDLAGAVPFTYSVNGESRTIEGAFHVPGEGVYVPEDRVPQLQLLASSAHTLELDNQRLFREHQSLERATAWKQGDTTLTGAPAIEAQRVYIARAGEVVRELFTALSKDHLNKYATVEPTGRVYQDGSPEYAIVPNEDAVKALHERMSFVADRADFNARREFSKASAPPPPPEPSIDQLALPTVQANIKALNLTGLTAADEKFLAGQIGRYVRAASPEEAKQFGSKQIVDASFGDVIRDRASLRQDSVAKAKAAEQAGKFNAGMNGSKAQAKPVQTRPNTPQPATPAKKVGKAQAWDDLLTSALPEVLQGMG